MATLEVFFDYACPFCLRGHEILLELLPQFPQMAIDWRPCEAHPRPERYGIHSDLCARGMLYAKEQGADLLAYHRIMYNAVLKQRANVEDLPVVAALVDGLLDQKVFFEALSAGMYEKALAENNRLAWGEYQFPAVPSYRMNGKLLPSIENVGVTKQRLAEFLAPEQA